MFAPAISVEEALRWKEWLAQFHLELYTTVMDERVYPLDLKTKDGKFLSAGAKDD